MKTSAAPKALVPIAWAAAIGLLLVRLQAEPVTVRHLVGLMHGFLTLRTLDGAWIADGDLILTTRGERVASRLVFHFKDGSLSDEAAVYTQSRQLQLVSDHLIQKGPSFPTPLDMTIDVASGQVAVRYTNEHREEKVDAERMQLPSDLANGMLLTVLQNITPDSTPTTASLLVATPKPRVVKLVISHQATDRFSTGHTAREATAYRIKIEIGGLAGVIAPLIGKQPPDARVWVLGGEAPAFVKAEQQMYMDGPIWRIELANPVWPSSTGVERR